MEFKPELLPKVLNELDRRRGRWKEICDATGISYSTLQKIAQGQVANPGVNTIEMLHSHLFGQSSAA